MHVNVNLCSSNLSNYLNAYTAFVSQWVGKLSQIQVMWREDFVLKNLNISL